MRRFTTVLVAAVLASWGLAGAARARSPTGTEVVRLGFTTFETAQDLSGDRSSYRSVEEYLRKAAEASATRAGFESPVEFDVHLGNHYQVLSWFRTGEIDAAVVSAFEAYVLENELGAIPIIELDRQEQATDDDHGYTPLVAGRADDVPAPDPVVELEDFLCACRAAAARAVGRDTDMSCAGPGPEAYVLNASAHLSTPSFIAPVLYARASIDAYLATWMPALDDRQRALMLRKYWDAVFAAVQFSFARPSAETAHSKKTRELFFSYSGHRAPDLDARAAKVKAGPWKAYGPDIRIPRDVLVLSPGASLRIHGSEQANMRAWPEADIGDRGSGYTRAIHLRGTTRDAFSRLVSCAFGRRSSGSASASDCSLRPDPVLAQTYDRWFTSGQYDFTVDDLVTLLRQDQENSGQRQLALVLPGGGVKAAYQSRLLDGLYDHGSLANVGAARRANAALPQDPPPPLMVDTIAGTSGGAMVGLFAARPRPNRKLENLWIDHDRVQTSASDIFPRLGMLRFSAMYAVALVLQLGLIVAFWFRRDHSANIASSDAAPKRVTAFLLLVLLLGPAVIRWTIGWGERRVRDAQDWDRFAMFGSYVPVVEATIYGVVVCLVHFTWTCCVTVGVAESPTSWGAFISALWRDLRALWKALRHPLKHARLRWLSAGLIAGGFVIMSAALLVGPAHVRFISVGQSHLYSASLLAAIGLLTAAVGTLLFAAGGSARAHIVGHRQYLEALGVLAAILGVSFAVVGVATWRGAATLLELSPQFWWWTLSTSAVVLVLVLLLRFALADKPGMTWLATSLEYMTQHHSFLGRRTTPLGSLLLVHGGALLLWALFVTPALYDNANALAFFRHRLEVDVGADRQPVGFTANLVVTGSSLEAVDAGETKLLPGDHYFCFDGVSHGCPRQIRSPRWHNVTTTSKPPSVNEVLDPVFASGSPFPVFPDHSVSLPDFKGRLVDGGFIHNTPLQAAALMGARQVLVVHSSPRDEAPPPNGRGWLSQLAENAARLLPFMFDQSQGTDRDVAPALTVASLAPGPVCEGHPFPFLADFRPDVVRRMVKCAGDDLEGNRRIGRIDSWGRPRLYARVTTRPRTCDESPP